MLEDLVRGLQRLDADFDAVSLADALWLCGLMPPGEGGGPAPGPAEQLAAPGPATDDGTAPAEGAQEEASAESPEGNDVFDSPGGHGSRPAVVDRTGRGPALPDDLALARALRPLKRSYPHGRGHALDTEATVRAYAETQELVPVLAPRPERWFHLDLVVDQSASMQVWQDVAGELLMLLQQLGAFRTVHRWQLDARSEEPLLYDASGAPVRPHRLRDPHGRRLVAVFSDCVDAGWHAPPIWQTLRSWAQSTATVLLDPLPPRLWPHTGLDGPVVPLTPAGPGARAVDMGCTVPAAVRMLSAMTPSGVGNWLPCPVAGISADSLAAWARTVMATGTEGCQGVLIPSCGRLAEADDDMYGDTYDVFAPGGTGPGPDLLAQAALSAHQLVRTFRHLASPAAGRLAVLCSRQTELSLPVLRAVQQAMEPDSGVAELAELIISGLFEHVPGSRTADLRLRFRAGVRGELHKFLAAEDAWQVHLALRRFHERETARRTHPVTVAAEQGGTRVPDGLAPFTTTSQVASRQEAQTRPTALILTTLALEYAAVRAHLADIEELVHPSTGTRVQRGRLTGTPWSVALAETGGGSYAAALTERLSTWLRPQVLVMVGVAGGLKDDIKIGDVVVATRVHRVPSTDRTLEGHLVRSEALYSSPSLVQTARHALRGKAHFKPIVVGDSVHADDEHEFVQHLRTLYDDAVAIEMEGAGFVQYAYRHTRADALIIRGISDRADAQKYGGNTEAARNAAAAAVAVLREFEPPDGDRLDFRGGVFTGSVTGKAVTVDVPLPDEDWALPTTSAGTGPPSPQTVEPELRGTGAGTPSSAQIVVLARSADPVAGGSRVRRVGIGLLLSPRLILTAGHIVSGAGARGAVKAINTQGYVTARGWRDCDVLWHDSTRDAALLLAGDDVVAPVGEAGLSLLSWGEMTGTGSLPGCEVIGLRSAAAGSALSHRGRLEGILYPSRRHDGSYEFEVADRSPLGSAPPDVELLSGAPLLRGDLVVGVTTSTSSVLADDLRLKVAAVSTLARDPEFARIIRAHLHEVPRLQPLPLAAEPSGNSASGPPATGGLPTLAQLTTAEQRWADREEDITTVSGEPYDVGEVFARRWIERLPSPDRLQELVVQYPRIPHRIDGELLRYAARFGLLAHMDDRIDEGDRHALRAGFWHEVNRSTPKAEQGEAATAENELEHVRVGVTGHREIPAAILPMVRDWALRRLDVGDNVVILSCLAPGTDQIFAEAARDHGIEMTAVVPGTDYEAQLGDEEARALYLAYNRSCAIRVDLPVQPTVEEAYLAAGMWIVDHADELVAVWDGRPARGLDRTADVVAYARRTGVPVTVLWKPGVTRDE